MEQKLIRAMAILNQISVRGDDAERMVVAMHLLRQVHGEMNKTHNPSPSKRKELSPNE